ncbi:predicted protein [Verticillium alfalfae VaMs.102]|uniref:Predicted protein n=1 Tax=Verticillium alfalfae (strain VaMs.102 / ATCC MYA-4576 / FGSC 10136) TaxID=526221 RepID=C9S5U4_VERA1|nr:predicted protein [Verticillium alfalfae VaMs.102]EEY15083.1 predicted protein [Verticillium alfalfae VaMs.102]
MQSLIDTTKASSSKQAAAPWPSTLPVDPDHDHDHDHDAATETAPPPFRRRRLTPWSPAWHWAKLGSAAPRPWSPSPACPSPPRRTAKARARPLRFGLPAHVVALAYDLAEWPVVQRHFKGAARHAARPDLGSVVRIALMGRAANEVYRLRMTTPSGDAIQYFHDADTNEPPVRVVVPSWHGVDAEAGGMEPPSGYRDADEQGSTDKVFLPSPSRE